MPITAVHAEPISGRIRPDLAIISSLGAHLVGQYVLVRVHDDAGRVGLGEASVTSVWSGETQAGTIALIRDVLTPLIVGADPFDLEWISRRLDRAAFANSFAKAAWKWPYSICRARRSAFPCISCSAARTPARRGFV